MTTTLRALTNATEMYVRSTHFCFLLIFGLSIIHSDSHAQNLKSLNQMYGSNASRLDDPVEQAYLLYRCSALNSVMSTVLEADFRKFMDDRGLRSKKLAEHFERRSREHLDRAMSLSGKTGETVESITRRITTFTEFYSYEIQRNRVLHNEILIGLVKEDMQVCK